MKADLYTAPARTVGMAGLAHRTAAGFLVLTSADGDDMIALIEERQNEPDLIDQVVDAAQMTGPAAFAMLFTAGGDMYALASGAIRITLTSDSTDLTLVPVEDQVLVHALGAGINENSATVHLELDDATDDTDDTDGDEPFDLEPMSGSVEATLIEIAIGGATLSRTLPAAAEPAHDPAVAAEAMNERPLEPEVVAVVPEAAEDLPGAAGILFANDDLADEPNVALEPSTGSAFDAPEATEPADPEPATATPPATADPDPDPAPAASPPPAQPTPEPADPPPATATPPATPDPVPAATRAASVAAAVPTPTPAARVGPVMVLGVNCSQGHHNHPDAVYCSQCGTKMGVHHTTVLINGPRPPLGVLVVDDGTTYSLNQDLVIGREPTSHEDVLTGTATPMILTDDTLSLSRKHARIVLDDWSVAAQDLNSSNGTYLSRAGQSENWLKITSGATMALEPGDRLRVGGRIIQVELHHVR